MESQLIFNGMLITSALTVNEAMITKGYRGVAYGLPWPLESIEQELTEDETELGKRIQSITMEYPLQNGKYSPDVISDLDIAKRYVDYCQQRSIAIRLLLCATDSPCPKMDAKQVESLLRVATFLGYDYILNECEFSGLFDDLTPPPAELSDFSQQLNQYGLFDNLDDLEKYISARWDLLRRTGERFVETNHGLVRVTELEDDENFWRCGVWEIPLPLEEQLLKNEGNQ